MKKTLLGAALAAVVLGSSLVPAVGEAINLPYSTVATKKILCYKTIGGEQKGWIDPGDDVIIKQINGNWAYVNYPTPSGRVERWCPLSDLYIDVQAPSVPQTPKTNTPTIVNNPVVTPVTRYPKLNNGFYIISSANVNRYLNATATGLVNYTNICIYDKIQNNCQIFYLENQSDGYFTLKASYTDLYLDALGGSSNNGTNVQLYEYNGSAAQRWRLIDGGNGTYYIESKLKKDFCLDCANGGTVNGTNVQLWTRGDVLWNKWKFTSVAAPKGEVPGDVNCDWKVNQADRDMLVKYRAGVVKHINMLNADLNGDGKVDLTDISRLEQKLNGSTTTNTTPTPTTTVTVPYNAVATSKIICYETAGGNQKGWIDPGDDVVVNKIEGNWAYVNYPVSNGRTNRWIPVSEISRALKEQQVTPVNSNLQNIMNRWNGKSWEPWGNYDKLKADTLKWPDPFEGEKAIGSECFGFANYVFKILHGTPCGTTVGKTHIVSGTYSGVRQVYTSTSTTAASLKDLFGTKAKPGDFIQGTNGNQHSMIFVSYNASASTVKVLHANWNRDNMIAIKDFTIDGMVKRFPKLSLYTK